MKIYGKIAAALVAGAMAISVATGVQAASRLEMAKIHVNTGRDFKYWTENSAAHKELVSFVEDVTNRRSKNFIPKEDRVAVFDMDGTFLCETAPYYFDHMLFIDRTLNDKTYTPSEDDRTFAEALNKWVQDKSSGENLGGSAPHQSSVFVGTNFPDYTAYVQKFMETPVTGLSNLKWGEALYLPMVEVIKYLEANDFKVYVVSGSERELVRVLVCDLLSIPRENIIGTDIKYLGSHQGDTQGLDYTFRQDDELIRGGFVIKNLKMNKVASIAREIGRQPVLAFGNSSGDAAMLNYTLTNNKYKSKAFFLLCDDLQRELGDMAKADKCRKLANDNGWVPVSMRGDFKTIYGDKVKRTK